MNAKWKKQNAKQCVHYATTYVKNIEYIHLYMLMYALTVNAYNQYEK